MEDYAVRLVTAEDASVLSEIYGYYVKNTAVTFEVEPPSPGELAQRITRYTKKYPYLVIEDEDGDPVGFAFAHAFRERPAYDYAAEVSIYLHKESRHSGYGRAIYTALESELSRMGIHSLYACIATCDRTNDPYLSADSPRFHAALGYRQCGEFRRCGRKFDRWYHMIYMEKRLCEPRSDPAPIIPYPDVIRSAACNLRFPLTTYDGKNVRLITRYGDLFYGEAMHNSADYNEHEFGRAEECLQVGTYLCFLSEIKHIEEI